MNTQTDNAGELDQSFASTGVFTLTLAPYRETIIFGIRIDPATEAIYFAGQARNGVSDRPYILGKLLPNGDLDSTFANAGIATGKFSNSAESKGKSIAFLAQGKILLIGAINSSPALARFHPDGSLDTTYGENGHLILANPSPSAPLNSEESASEPDYAQSRTVALEDGRILISFTYHQSGKPISSYLFMLDNNGELDLSFNQSGNVQVKHPDHPPEDIQLFGSLIDEDGNAVACGNLETAGTSAFMLVRYTPDGRIDNSFEGNGFVIESSTAEYSLAYASAKQENKRILGVGYARTGSNYSGLLISVEPNGTRNIQFNSARPQLNRLNGADTLWISGLKLANGSLVIAGTAKASGKTTIALASLLSNGAFDTTFNNGQGWAVPPSDMDSSSATGLALQNDGKTLVCGHHSQPSLRGLILRYLG